MSVGLVLSSLCLVPGRLGQVGKWAQKASPAPGAKPGASAPLTSPSPLQPLLLGATPLSPGLNLTGTAPLPSRGQAAPPQGRARLLLSGTCSTVSSPALPLCVWWGRGLRVAAGPRVFHLHPSCRLRRRSTGPACPTIVPGRCSCRSC